MSEIKTFIEFFDFLKSLPEEDFSEWITEHWDGKDKQESCLRLFAKLGLISKLNDFDMCQGNFNMKTIKPITQNKEIFYEGSHLINLKDKGDSSDLTGIHKKNKKELLLTTSKNITKMTVGLLDIDKILTNFKQYEKNGYTMRLCICIRRLNDFEIMKSRIEKTNKELKNLISSAIIIDLDDLYQAFHHFKSQYQSIDIETILSSNKKPLCLKMHQEMSVIKTIELKETKHNILWGHIQRSGKSYIIAGCIIKDSSRKEKCNYLVITTAPNETIEQQIQVFDCIQLQDFGIILLNGTTISKKPLLKDKNIFVCSKQFLQTKIESDERAKSIPWLKKIVFDMRFIDESHNGGTTTLAKKVLEYYGPEATTIQITATYSKPCNDYGIQKDSWILWDLEDVQLCKTIDKEESIIRLVEKHGQIIQNIIKCYSVENIIAEYSKYPELWIMTERLKPDVISEIIKETSDNHYGYSTEACFLLQQCLEDGIIKYSNKFQNEEKTLEVFYRIFGKKNRFGIPDKDFPDEDVFIKKIERICKNPLTKSRFIGDSREPMIIMAFLPQNNVDKISTALISLLDQFRVVPDYHMISINSHTTDNPRQEIEKARDYARLSDKKGVIVFSGRQCSLGVSIHNCDIVLLLNSNTSYDMIYQMMFRCMTEGDGKRCGFVIDMNIQRVIETSIITYSSLIKPSDHPRDAIRYILQERIINLNGDDWMTSFGNIPSKIDEFCHTIYNIYSSNTERALQHFIERLRFKDILLSKDEQKMFNTIFSGSNAKITQKQKVDIKLLLDEHSEKIKNGIEKVGEIEEDDYSESELEEDSKINYMDILKHIIPLLCILTIRNEETSFIGMFNHIELNPEYYQILIDQTRCWWNKSIDSLILKKIIHIYIKYMADDIETNQIIRTIKELFMKNITNMKELSCLIDKYFIPQELEKKLNAEIPTPHKLRQEMINIIPLEFWTSPRRVFEPCAGKGGFLIDIIDRFMVGLSSTIPDEKIRYKVIVEECLYFSDINKTNIFICNLLIDPNNEYSLNFNEGNTLELNIQEKWSIDGFNAVIGNPPYNTSGNTGTGNTIWQDFTKKSINNWLLPNGYLIFVHPSGWRKPNTERGKFVGLYDLMTKQNQMLYLEIHGIKDGQKTFKCGTRYDWYLIEKKKSYKNTTVIDEYGKSSEIDMKKLSWLPNSNILEIDRLIAKDVDEICPIIYDRSSYGSDKKNTSDTQSKEFKYPIIHTFLDKGIRYLYSNTNKNGHFGISKVIFGQSNSKNPFADIDGKYGMSEHSMAIQVSSKDEALNIVKTFQNPKFQSILSSCSWSNFMIDWRLFTFFRKDFWREFA